MRASISHISADQVSQFPTLPGVYVMRSEKGEILYIGKAKNLRARVSTYFSTHRDGRYQIEFLMRRVYNIEPMVTSNEKEALLLENTLIKAHQPRYNLFLKDDKSYLSLKLTLNHDFPRLFLTRNRLKDGSLYFGPYPSGAKAKEVYEWILKTFKMRTCNDHEFSNRSRPCLEYQIKRCDAPCVAYISQTDYAHKVEQVRWFLEGKNAELLKVLRHRMQQAADQLQFEQAAEWRNLLQAIEVTLEKQKAVNAAQSAQDAVGFFREADQVSLIVLSFREGLLLEGKPYLSKNYQEDSEVLEQFLLQFYSDPSLIPDEILISLDLKDTQAVLEEILSEKKGKRVVLKNSGRGEKREKIELAQKNAEQRLKRKMLDQQSLEETLKELRQLLELKRSPRRIECYDISNLQETNAVGSCVCFENGKPERAAYRKFKIRWVKQQNDFAMHYEVMRRRLEHPEWPFPDLMIIDGGKGQLASAEAALKDANIEGVDLVALAKERGTEIEKEALKPERVFLLNRKDSIVLPKRSAALHLLVQIRDEAHRFGITFHRSLRKKTGLSSRLDSIDGVGPARKMALIKHFGSLKKISEASIEELSSVEGISQSQAENIYQQFHRSLPSATQ